MKCDAKWMSNALGFKELWHSKGVLLETGHSFTDDPKIADEALCNVLNIQERQSSPPQMDIVLDNEALSEIECALKRTRDNRHPNCESLQTNAEIISKPNDEVQGIPTMQNPIDPYCPPSHNQSNGMSFLEQYLSAGIPIDTMAAQVTTSNGGDQYNSNNDDDDDDKDEYGYPIVKVNENFCKTQFEASFTTTDSSPLCPVSLTSHVGRRKDACCYMSDQWSEAHEMTLLEL